MRLCKLASAVTIVAALCSCAFLKAAWLPEAEGRPGGELELTLFMYSPKIETDEVTENRLNDLPSDDLETVCGCPPPPMDCPLPEEPRLAPIPGILALAAVSLAFSELTSALVGYVEAKRKRFAPAPYVARINVPAFRFLPGNGPEDPALRCVRLIRKYEEENEYLTASDVIVSFERPRYGGEPAEAGMIAVLRYLKLGDFSENANDGEGVPFAASTRAKADIKKQSVKANVAVGFSILTESGGPGLGDVAAFDQSLDIPVVKQGKPVEFPGFSDPNTNSMSNQTGIMPEPTGQPATIVMAVTEVGEGVAEFAEFDEQQFRASANIITQALGNVIKLKILPNQPAP